MSKTSNDKQRQQSQGAAQIASSDLLARRGFTFITDPFEQKRIRGEIRRLRAARDASQLGFSEEESALLYKYSRGPRPVWATFVLDPISGKRVVRLSLMAKITSLLDDQYCRLYRSGCIWWIRCLRLLRRVKSFWLADS